ncbi:restriction endonuclease subunit S [Fructobacillus sp. M1-21]|uniref:Restriction endonuclease subunit S n=2 Tax=Fructobacillus papyrifericola TaxID=2713172 RepID=A0ABS5QUE3_9LACO|nr:restriction endonuclease subunit S [Fructobacillus papyrifericola]
MDKSKQKKMVPAIRFSGFTDDWEQRKFEDILVPFSIKSKVENEYPVLSSTNGGMEFRSGRVSGASNKGYKIIGNGDLVLSPQNLWLGNININNIGKGLVSPSYKTFKFKNINPEFVAPQLKIGRKLKEYKDSSTQGASVVRRNLEMNYFYEITLLVPNIEEQNRIGELIKKLEIAITLHQRKLENLEALKKLLLQKMFPKNGQDKPDIRFNGFTDDWEQRKVSDIFQVTRGHVLSAKAVSPIKTDSNPYPVYSSQTKNNGLMGYYNEYLFNNAITWTTDGANAGTVNYRPGQFYSTNVNGVLLSNDGYVNKAVAESLDKVSYKFVSHVGNPKLMNNVMSEIIINIPSEIAEQARMSELLIDLDHSVTLHQRKLQKLDDVKRSLLQNMFV